MKAPSVERQQAAAELSGMRAHPGWRRFEREVRERMQDSLRRIEDRMDRKPETLTGKVAFRDAMRHRALAELLDWVDDEIRMGGGEA